MPRSSELVPQRVRELRQRKRWSQEKLAEEAGVSKDAVSRIERGDREPRIDTLEQIAEALGTNLSRLFDFTKPLRLTSVQEDHLRVLKQALITMEPWLAQEMVKSFRDIARAQREARAGAPEGSTPRRG